MAPPNGTSVSLLQLQGCAEANSRSLSEGSRNGYPSSGWGFSKWLGNEAHARSTS